MKTKMSIARKKKLGSLSIKNALKGDYKPTQEVQKVEESKQIIKTENTVTEAQPFTLAELEKAWNDYALSIKADKPRMNSLLKASTPILGDNFEVTFSLSNDLQEKAIQKEQAAILASLQKKLNNGKISLKIIIKKENVKKALYTDKDKLNYLIEKNPNVSKLTQNFKLDF